MATLCRPKVVVFIVRHILFILATNKRLYSPLLLNTVDLIDPDSGIFRFSTLRNKLFINF